MPLQEELKTNDSASTSGTSLTFAEEEDAENEEEDSNSGPLYRNEQPIRFELRNELK